jgi:hypothetical protein
MVLSVPPVPDPRVEEFGFDKTMVPTWRQFWAQLTLYVKGTPNGSVMQASTSYANDAAAAAGGVPIGGFYRNGSVIQVRIV